MRVPQPVKSVVIANIGEFLFQHPFSGTEARMDVLDRITSDHALFWAGGDAFVITRFPVQESFVKDICHILGYRNLQVVTPVQVSQSLSDDIVSDIQFFTFLVETLHCSPNAQIIFYGVTRQIYSLLDRLQQAGVTFHVPDLPASANYNIVHYLDSKAGFHDFCLKLALQCPLVAVPEGIVCQTVEQAVQMATTLIAQQRSVVIKSNASDANIGTEMYTPKRIGRLGDKTLEHTIRHNLATWQHEEQILIENYIQPFVHTETPSPAIQALITAEGQTKVIGIASQLVGPNGRYQGAEVGPYLFSPALRERLSAITYAIGEAAAALGYRGMFGIDTVLANNDKVYCIEMNSRRIGSLVLFDLARALSLRYGMRESDLSLRCESMSLVGQTYSTLHSRLTPLLFPKDGKPEGLMFIGAPTQASGTFKLLAISEDINISRSLCMQARSLLGIGALEKLE